MKPLSKSAEDAAITIMLDARAGKGKSGMSAKQVLGPFEEEQARLDLRHIPWTLDSEICERGKRKIPSDGRLLIKVTVELYLHHTQDLPGRSILGDGRGTKDGGRKVGGLYWRFLLVLAEDLGIEAGKLHSTIKDARDKLNENADNEIAKRRLLKKDRMEIAKELLDTHVEFYVDDDGEIVENPTFEPAGETLDSDDGRLFAGVDGPEPIMGGYQPAPDHDIRASEVFKGFLDKVTTEKKPTKKKDQS
jgi:hypothetical protein